VKGVPQGGFADQRQGAPSAALTRGSIWERRQGLSAPLGRRVSCSESWRARSRSGSYCCDNLPATGHKSARFAVLTTRAAFLLTNAPGAEGGRGAGNWPPMD